MFTRFPAHRSAEEGTEDLPCELGARKKCSCNPFDRLRSTSSSQDQELVGHLLIELSFLLCKFLSRDGCSLEFSPTGAWFVEDGLAVPGRYTALSNDKKMETILHRELECKVEKVKHMKLEVMWPKIKNNMNFQPE